jgi:citrate lyase subunit beta / citryl-CoA lyase
LHIIFFGSGLRRNGLIDWTDHPLRSLLFAPGSDERKLAKVGTFGADLVVIDLEDAVADEEKAGARVTTREAIPRFDEGTAVAVRVNGVTTGTMEDDIAAVVCPRLDAIMVPKVEDAETLARADAAMADAERAAGMDVGAVRLLVLIETPLGLTRCEDILARAPERTLTAVFGAGDFTTELGVDLTPHATEILFARSRLVVAARAAGLPAPIDGPWLHLQDTTGLEADCARSRGLGFQGRVTVYPPQVEPVQRAYSALGDEEVEKLRKVVAAFEEAEAQGVASIRVDGLFVDYPIYRLARERLVRYDAWRSAAGAST